jgi:hypothetical protein
VAIHLSPLLATNQTAWCDAPLTIASRPASTIRPRLSAAAVVELPYSVWSFHQLDFIAIALHQLIQRGLDCENNAALMAPTCHGTIANHLANSRISPVRVEVVNHGSCRPKEGRGFADGRWRCVQVGVGDDCGEDWGPAVDQHARGAGVLWRYSHMRKYRQQSRHLD